MAENIRFDIIARDETTRAFRQIDANLNRTMAGFRKFEAGITGFRSQIGTALAAAASITGAVYLEKRFVDMGSAIGDTADKIGLTTDELQALRYGAQMAGVETETLDSAMLVFSRNLGQAELGLGKTADALDTLGISLGDIKGQSPAEILDRVADALGRIEDPMRRNALAAQLFGRAGAQLGPLLSEGSAGLAAYRDEAERFGVVVHEDIIRANQEAGDSFDVIGSAIDAAGMNIAAGFLPAIREIEDIMTSPGFQGGIRDAAAAVADFAEEAISHYDELVAFAGVLGRIYLAVQGAKLGRVGGPVGMAAGAAAGYFAPEIASRLSTVGDGSAPLDPNSTTGRPVLSLDVTEPANAAEVSQYNAARDALATALRQRAAQRKDGWASGDWLDGGDGYTDGGFGGGGGGGGGGKRSGGGRAASYDRAAEAIKRVTDGLNEELQMLGMTDRERAIYNELLRAGVSESDAAGEAIAALAGQLYDETEALQQSQDAWGQVRDLTLDFASGIKSDMLGGASAVEALGNAFGRLGDRLLDLALDQAISSFFDNLSSGGAKGGGGAAGGVFAALGKLLGFADGGWTGGKAGQPAGIVHGEEFVVPAGPAARNRALLEDISAGRPLGVPMPDRRGGGPLNVTLAQTINLEGANGDQAVREIAMQAVAQGGEAILQTVRGSVTGWMMQDQAQRGGDYRIA